MNIDGIYIGKVIKFGNSEGVSIPADIRRALGIKRGDRVTFSVRAENEVTVRKITPSELQNLRVPIIN